MTDIGAELIVERIPADSVEGFADLMDEGDGPARIIVGDPVGNLFQVAFDEG